MVKTLDGAWNLMLRNHRLVLWELASLCSSAALVVVGALLATMTVGIFVSQHDWNTLSGWLGAAWHAMNIASSRSFWLGATGVVFTLGCLGLAFGALFQAGLYGRLAAVIRGDVERAGWRDMLRDAREHFPALVGYAGVRLALMAIWVIFTAVVALWPLAVLALEIAQGAPWSWWQAALCGLGMTASLVLMVLLYCWRMLALGPLMLEGKGLGEAFAVAYESLSGHLRGGLRLVLGASVVVSPAVLTYAVFGVMAWLLSTRPDLTHIASALSLVLDLGMVLVIAGTGVFMGAAFLLDHAWRTEMIDTFPDSKQAKKKPRRAAPTTDELLAAGEDALGVKLPRSFPNRFAISSLFEFELEAEVDDVPCEPIVAAASAFSEAASQSSPETAANTTAEDVSVAEDSSEAAPELAAGLLDIDEGWGDDLGELDALFSTTTTEEDDEEDVERDD